MQWKGLMDLKGPSMQIQPSMQIKSLDFFYSVNLICTRGSENDKRFVLASPAALLFHRARANCCWSPLQQRLTWLHSQMNSISLGTRPDSLHNFPLRSLDNCESRIVLIRCNNNLANEVVYLQSASLLNTQKCWNGCACLQEETWLFVLSIAQNGG